MNYQVNRITPNLPVQNYKTYAINAPKSTHFEPASCEETDCPSFLNGWAIVVLPWTEQGQKQEHLIRDSRKSYEVLTADEAAARFPGIEAPDGSKVYAFFAGQDCFAAPTHVKRLERPEIYTVRGGDWRGVTSPARLHSRPIDWVEDFNENQERLERAIERG